MSASPSEPIASCAPAALVRDDEAWMRQALALANQAATRGEVPVGALVVRAGESIGRGYNRPITACDPSAHAEMVAVRAAAICTGNYRLPGATLYVTLEPCPMCMGVIIHSRLARVVFAASDSRWGAAGSVLTLAQPGRFNHDLEVTGGVLAEPAAACLKRFFRARR